MDPVGAGRRLLLERLLHDALQFAALVQLADDVAAADELAVHEDLRDRRPVGEALDRRASLASSERRPCGTACRGPGGSPSSPPRTRTAGRPVYLSCTGPPCCCGSRSRFPSSCLRP